METLLIAGLNLVIIDELLSALITKIQLAHEIYHLDFYYSKEGYTLVEDFDSLDDAWEKTKEYIAYFRL
jgi:hypothetical protein